jgi:muconolactone delta-isomerase
MNQYMAEITLPSYLSQEFAALIPRQRALVDELFTKGVISGYTLALDRSKLWVTFIADSESDVRFIISGFPIFHYIEYTLHELAFHEAAATTIPAISLN